MRCSWLQPQLTRHLKERAANVDARAARLVARRASHGSDALQKVLVKAT